MTGRADRAELVTRVMKARRETTCPLCHGPIHVGQVIAKCGFWAHASCVVDHRHQHHDEEGDTSS